MRLYFPFFFHLIKFYFDLWSLYVTPIEFASDQIERHSQAIIIFLTQVGYLNFERQSTSIAAVGIANGMMVSCNKLRSGFDNVGSVTGTFYPPVASPHDQSLQHYSGTQTSKSATNYSMQSTVESNYNPVQCASSRQQSIGIRGATESCPGNVSFLLTHVKFKGS